MEFIDLKEQYRRYQAEIDAGIQKVLQHGHYIMGPEIGEIESALANYVGVAHCLTVASGTHSLEIALRALGVGVGDEVITVPFSWISTAEVIGLVGANPVFVDIERETYNINIDLLERAITPRTKAILPVSLFGQMPDYVPDYALVVGDPARQSGWMSRHSHLLKAPKEGGVMVCPESNSDRGCSCCHPPHIKMF